MSPAEYRTRADRHKPTTMAGIASAVAIMAANGMSDHDIAHVLGLDPDQVRRLSGMAR